MLWQCSKYTFDTNVPKIMGILNVTPDSFSDGGEHNTFQKAIDHAISMIDDGASIIDVGGESTRPGSSNVEWQDEWDRIEKIVEELAKKDICVSVDTRHWQVASLALERGASIINDISGFTDPKMVEAVKDSDCGLVCMHMRGTPQTMTEITEYDDVVGEVCSWLDEQCKFLESLGIDKSRICIDPGPGFAKTPEQTLLLMRNIHELRHLGYPILAAPSRKRYLSLLSNDDKDDRDFLTAQECLRACELGADFFRVHNVGVTAAILEDLRPRVILSLGANVALVGSDSEEREECIKDQINLAIQEIVHLPDTEVVDVAPFFRSSAAYREDQDDFLNTVVILRSGIAPSELLDYLHVIENSLGRVREIENGPRTIDIDIVDYQLYVCESEKLTLPHPRAAERDFVVSPLECVLPNHVFADGTQVGSIDRQSRVGQSVLI